MTDENHNSPGCAHREWAQDDGCMPSGPRCDRPVTHTTCQGSGAPVCEQHKCRCSKPLTAKSWRVHITTVERERMGPEMTERILWHIRRLEAERDEACNLLGSLVEPRAPRGHGRERAHTEPHCLCTWCLAFRFLDGDSRG